jgi:MYXO-CTERM domain-containing protein
LKSCSSDSQCASTERCVTDVCVVRSGEGEGEGEGEPAGECDVRRGNMDCPSGEGCVERDGLGECVAGRDGDLKNGELCERDRDCGSGLCNNGVCTRTCDEDGCRDGYRCLRESDSGVPGGLCRAESCADDPDICGDFECSYSSAERYVCAVGPSNYRGFPCGAAPASTAPAAGLLAVLAVGLARRRRRR